MEDPFRASDYPRSITRIYRPFREVFVWPGDFLRHVPIISPDDRQHIDLEEALCLDDETRILPAIKT